MGLLLAVLFFVVPALEIYVIIQVGGALGALPTLGLVAATAIVGAWLARQQGTAAMRGIAESMARGNEVGQSVASAALVLVAAVSMVTPGFVTDALGLALLLPPIRSVCAQALVRWVQSRTHLQTAAWPPESENDGDNRVIDV